MTSILTSPDQPSPPQDERWQEHWPNVAYAVDYDHENNKQIDPEVMTQLMLEMGVPDHEIPSLSIFVENWHKKEGGKYYFITDDQEPAMMLRYNPDPVKRTATALHETTHFVDDLAGDLEAPLITQARKFIGSVIGLGAAAVITAGQYKTGVYEGINPLGVVMTANMTGAAYGAGSMGKYIGYRMSPDERRAFKAQKDKTLLDKYKDGLYK